MSMRCVSSTACSARSKAPRSLPNAVWSTTAVAMPAALRDPKPAGVRPFDTTSAISAG